MLSKDTNNVLFNFNNSFIDYCRDETFIELFEKQAELTPELEALVFKDKKITYRELNNKANQLARIMRAKGVKANTIVGIMIRRSIEMVVSILSILKAGGAYLPIDPEYPEDRIRYILKDSCASILLSEHSLKDKIIFNKEVVYVDDEVLYTEPCNNVDKINKSEDIAYLIYTSGSTGRPKGVMIPHRAIRNLILGITDKIDFAQGKTILAVTTISFDIFVLEVLIPLARGLKVIIADENEQKNPKALKQLIESSSIDMIQMTPSRLNLLLDYEKDLSFLKAISEVMVGGESFSKTLLEKLRGLVKGKIFNMYGPTETTVWSLVADLTDCNIITIGKPIANTQVYVVDEDCKSVPIGGIGELCISGDGLAIGYYNQEEMTKQKFIDNPFNPGTRLYKTGDLAKWLPDGQLECLGRIDNQIKLNGFRIELEEIEYQLLKNSAVKEAVVVAKSDEQGNKYLCAYIMSAMPLDTAEIKNYLASSLPSYMIPSIYIYVDEIPTTPNGKVDRKLLESLVDNIEAESGEVEVSSNISSVERIVKEILKRNITLPIALDSFKREDDMELLGLNSMTYVKIIVDLEDEFEFEISDNYLVLGSFMSFGALLDYIEANRGN